MHKIVKFIFIKNKNENTYIEMINIIHDDKKIKVLAYYDSANILYKNGNFVCVIDECIANKLNLISKNIDVSTVIGNKKMQYVTLNEVELIDSKKYFHKVKCLVTNNCKYQFIMHRDMR